MPGGEEEGVKVDKKRQASLYPDCILPTDTDHTYRQLLLDVWVFLAAVQPPIIFRVSYYIS
jgi:hypothetical protein